MYVNCSLGLPTSACEAIILILIRLSSQSYFERYPYPCPQSPLHSVPRHGVPARACSHALVAGATLLHLLIITRLSIYIYTLGSGRSTLDMADRSPEFFLALPHQIVYIHVVTHVVCPLSSNLNDTLSFLLIQFSRPCPQIQTYC